MAIEQQINPFINDFRVSYAEYITGTSKDDNDVQQIYGYQVELDSPIRLYTSKTIREFLFKNLSSRARDYFTALQYFTNKDYQHVIFTHEKMCDLLGKKINQRGFHDGVQELIKFKIIACKNKSKGEYWYNPKYYCFGNRLKLYKMCAIKMKSANQIPQRLNM